VCAANTENGLPIPNAIAALDGDRPDGTLVDHLAVEGRPRIQGTRRRIAEERELLEKAERELAKVRRQFNDPSALRPSSS